MLFFSPARQQLWGEDLDFAKTKVKNVAPAM